MVIKSSNKKIYKVLISYCIFIEVRLDKNYKLNNL